MRGVEVVAMKKAGPGRAAQMAGGSSGNLSMMAGGKANETGPAGKAEGTAADDKMDADGQEVRRRVRIFSFGEDSDHEAEKEASNPPPEPGTASQPAGVVDGSLVPLLKYLSIRETTVCVYHSQRLPDYQLFLLTYLICISNLFPFHILICLTDLALDQISIRETDDV